MTDNEVNDLIIPQVTDWSEMTKKDTRFRVLKLAVEVGKDRPESDSATVSRAKRYMQWIEEGE